MQKKVLGVLKRIGALIIILTLLFAFALFSFKTANTYKYSLKGEEAYFYEGYLKIGDIDQFVRIKGGNKNNPVMLFLHGGPGNPLSCVSYTFAEELYGDFTVCEIDERGSGRTYEKNHELPTFELLLRDIDELTDYLLKEFKINKIILAGYSFGSAIGLKYAQLHPQKISAYIGIGQCVNMKSALNISYEKYLAEGNPPLEDYSLLLKGNASAEESIKAYLSVKNKIESASDKSFQKDGLWYFLSALAGPYTDFTDLSWKMKQTLFLNEYISSQKELLEYLYTEFDAYDVKSLNCPAYFITGENDAVCPPELTLDFAASLSAPYVSFVTIKKAGHSVMFDNAEAFRQAVKSAAGSRTGEILAE